MKIIISIFIIPLTVLMVGCSSTKPAPSRGLENITPGFSGKFCQYEPTSQLGGIAISKNEGAIQNSIGNCFHAWPKSEMVMIFVDDNTEQTSEEARSEMLDELIHPEDYLTDAEAAEIDCASGSECYKNAEMLRHGVIVHFDSGRYEPLDGDVLPRFVRAVGNKHVSVVVIGHTDNTFTKSFNEKLSKNRAQRVKDVLMYLGLNSNQISIDWKGYSMPVGSNDTADGRAKNRRSEVSVQVK